MYRALVSFITSELGFSTEFVALGLIKITMFRSLDKKQVRWLLIGLSEEILLLIPNILLIYWIFIVCFLLSPYLTLRLIVFYIQTQVCCQAKIWKLTFTCFTGLPRYLCLSETSVRHERRRIVIKKYIWPWIEPFFKDKRMEPIFVIFGGIAIIYGILYTVAQLFLG